MFTTTLTGIKLKYYNFFFFRDSFCAPEVEIFKAVHNWVGVNADVDSVDECSDILSEVRLSLIPTQDLLKTVRPTNLVQPDILLDAIQARTEFRDMELKYRGYLSRFIFWLQNVGF